MLAVHLHQAGFFPIQWVATDLIPGTTYVRPSASEVLRIFVPAVGEEIEVYSGSLFAAKLRYRGPVRGESELLQLVNNQFSTTRAA